MYTFFRIGCIIQYILRDQSADMVNKTQMAIIIVAIVIIAGASVAFVHFSNDDKEYRSSNTDSRLMIYGNANGDDYLDSEDLDMIQKIIDQNLEWKQSHPFADANNDGKVNQADIDFVKKLINRESMQVYYHNTMTSSATAIQYPIKNVVTILAEVGLATKILGNTENLRGYQGSLDPVLFSDLPSDVTKFSGSGDIPIETLSKMKVDAVVTLPTESYVTNEKELNNNGIPVLRLGYRDSNPVSAYLTYGYLLQQEDRANEYARFVDETLQEIQDTVSAKVADSDRVSGMVLGYNVIYGRISNYGNVLEMAGAKNAVDWYEHRYVRDGMEWLYEYKFDYIVGRVSAGGYDYSVDEDGYADVEKAWNNHVNTYKLTDAVNKGHLALLNTSVPTVINAAYLAEEFYPDLFEEGYGDKIHQKYVDAFIDNLSSADYDVQTQGLFFITKADIKA